MTLSFLYYHKTASFLKWSINNIHRNMQRINKTGQITMKKSTQKTTPVQTGFYVLFFVILISKYIEDITALYDEVLKGYADNRNG